MSHYRLSKIRQQDILLRENHGEYQLEPMTDIGSAKAKDKKEEFLSRILEALNEIFVTEKLTDKDKVNYAYTVLDKLTENQSVMRQIANNTRDQAMLGDFPKALDDAILGSSEAHQEQMMELMSDPSKHQLFAHTIFDMIEQQAKQMQSQNKAV